MLDSAISKEEESEISHHKLKQNLNVLPLLIQFKFAATVLFLTVLLSLYVCYISSLGIYC